MLWHLFIYLIHGLIQHYNILYVFPPFWAIFACLDPDPHNQLKPDPIQLRNWFLQCILYCISSLLEHPRLITKTTTRVLKSLLAGFFSFNNTGLVNYYIYGLSQECMVFPVVGSIALPGNLLEALEPPYLFWRKCVF
jgi:hypothetical protein